MVPGHMEHGCQLCINPNGMVRASYINDGKCYAETRARSTCVPLVCYLSMFNTVNAHAACGLHCRTPGAPGRMRVACKVKKTCALRVAASVWLKNVRMWAQNHFLALRNVFPSRSLEDDRVSLLPSG